MKLGAYEFEWVPDEMDIPRLEKTTAMQENLGNVGYFAWGPQLIGKEVKMKWRFTSVAQYDAFKAMYLAGGVHVLDLNPERIFIAAGEGAAYQWPDPNPYPAPGYEGEVGGPTYRRFYISPVRNAPWVDIGVLPYVVQYDQPPPWDNWPVPGGGNAMVLNVSDPLNAYIEMDQGGYGNVGLPGWQTGAIIMDDYYNASAIVLPWDADVRQYYLYPDPPLTTTKIYYDMANALEYQLKWYPEVAGAGSFPYEVDAVNPTQIMNDYFSDNGYSILTECGEDAHGSWIKIRPDSGYSQVRVCGGEYMSSYRGGWRSFVVVPWGP